MGEVFGCLILSGFLTIVIVYLMFAFSVFNQHLNEVIIPLVTLVLNAMIFMIVFLVMQLRQISA